MFDTSFEALHAEDHPLVLFRGIVGSRAYGTHHAQSDVDMRGIFAPPPSAYLTLTPPPMQVSDARNDKTYYSLLRFCTLMVEANPTTLEMLYLPNDCLLKVTPAAQLLIENRSLFISQKAVDSHLGYALSQIKKAKGVNKRVWNPWPETPPQAEDYCLFLNDINANPIPLNAAKLPLARCCVVRLAAHLFALYLCHAPTKGLFHGGVLYEAKPNDSNLERRLGLLVYNEQAFQHAKRQHRDYWQWRQHRNETRWIAQEKGEMDYDAKNMMHLVRLLISGEHLVKEGAPLVRFEGEELETLRSIRRGEWSFEDILSLAEEKQRQIESRKHYLPPDCNRNAIDRLMKDVMKVAGCYE